LDGRRKGEVLPWRGPLSKAIGMLVPGRGGDGRDRTPLNRGSGTFEVGSSRSATSVMERTDWFPIGHWGSIATRRDASGCGHNVLVRIRRYLTLSSIARIDDVRGFLSPVTASSRFSLQHPICPCCTRGYPPAGKGIGSEQAKLNFDEDESP